MSEVQSPTCGRIVHFFPKNENDKICAFNNAEKVPAIVVQSLGNLSANLSVFPMNPDATNVLRYSVLHASEVHRDEAGNPTGSYWDWPEKDESDGRGQQYAGDHNQQNCFKDRFQDIIAHLSHKIPVGF